MQKKTISFLIIFPLLGIDQYIKYLILKNYHQIVSLNKGSSFSLDLKNPILISIVALILFLFLYFKIDKKSQHHLAFSFIVAGAMSNIIDRLVRGGVIDYISIKFWPTFNISDALISIGSAILIFEILKTFRGSKVKL